jgi:hypothetical protein
MTRPIGTKDAARLLGVTPAIVVEACKAGVIEHAKFGPYHVMDNHTIIGYDRKGWPHHTFQQARRHASSHPECRWCHQPYSAPVHASPPIVSQP